MATGTIHDIAPDLWVIEGHHPHSLWDDPDLPSIAIYRSGRRLYLLDTGVGPAQYEAILEVVARCPVLDEVVLLNSHGHVDHLGNNHVLDAIDAPRKSHFIPRDSRSALDYAAFFARMYRSGLPYFDYLSGLDLDPERLAGLLRALGADTTLHAEDLTALGRTIDSLGITPAIADMIPALVVEILLQTYPATFPRIDSMTDFEDTSPAHAITIGQTEWTGWAFPNVVSEDDSGGGGEVDVYVLQSGGHSAGGVVFYIPARGFLMMADETSALPIWSDSDPRRTVATATRALSMVDSGHIRHLCAGHRPMLPSSGDQARAALAQIVDSAREFARTVNDEIARHPDGICIDDLYEMLVADARPDSVITLAARLQFPVFATFLKLTVLNHCLLDDGIVEYAPATGRPVFRRV
jgi:glyoxylase-like metal-dependent hydrolase (beta-lactamase superfamily II)